MDRDADGRVRLTAAEAIVADDSWREFEDGPTYALAAAVLALLLGTEPHIYSGLCPDDDDWRVMDAMCPACRALAAAADMLPEDGGDE